MPAPEETRRLIATDTRTNTAAKTYSGANTFSGANTHSGAATFSGANTHSGAATFSGAVTFSAGLTHTGVSTAPTPITTSIDLTLTDALHAGKVVRTTATNKDLTLPASVAGKVFTMVVGVAATTGGATLKVTSGLTTKVAGGTSGKGLINTAATDAAGDTVTVIGDGTDYWIIAQRGTWDAES